MTAGYGKNGSVDLRQLRSFAAIAGTLNFSRAAEQLHVTQPALSRQMRDLEAEFDRNLFDRVNRGVLLTDAGRKFLRGARKVLAAHDALVASMRGRASRESPPLRLAHFGPLVAQYISPYLRRLMRRHARVRLQIEEFSPGDALRDLRAGKLDAAFTGPPGDKMLRGLETRTAWFSTQDILVSADHALAKRRRVTLRELRGEQWAVWSEKDFPGFGRFIQSTCRKAGFRAKITATVDSLASVFIHVAGGDYISHAPTLARKLPHAGVVFLPIDPPGAMDFPVQLVWRPDSPHADAIRRLADAMGSDLPKK